MNAFGVDLSNNVLTVSGEGTGGAGTLTFDLTSTLGEKLGISVDVTSSDTRVTLATKIESAIDTATTGNSRVTTATTTLAAGTIATGDGSGTTQTISQRLAPQ